MPVQCPTCLATLDLLRMSFGADEHGLFLECYLCGHKGRPVGGASEYHTTIDLENGTITDGWTPL